MIGLLNHFRFDIIDEFGDPGKSLKNPFHVRFPVVCFIIFDDSHNSTFLIKFLVRHCASFKSFPF